MSAQRTRLMTIVLIAVLIVWFAITRIALPSYHAGVLIIDVNSKKYTSLPEAALYGSRAGINRLIGEGANLEATDHKGQTALLIAAKTDNFAMVEMLLDAGADMWTTSDFGWTVGYALETSNVQSSRRDKLIERLRVAGFPFPAPHPDNVKEMLQKGTWPPND
jgi:hypothetical protein